MDSTAGAVSPCLPWGCCPQGSLAAFAAGVVFLAAVLFVPFLEGLFQVAPFTLEQIGLCAILALLPTVIIQIGKCAGLR